MELLRIIAMLMIITLHYLDKGNVLQEFSGMSTWQHCIAWILEAFCYVSVNIYVLISGYFLVKSRFTVKKLVILWLQIVFYSWSIGLLFFATGMVPAEYKTLYELIFVAFPVTSGHYWFATIYVLLFALSPFLNAAIDKMNRAQHKACVVVLLIIFSLWNTLLPFTIPVTDFEGMDIAWFVSLYMIAAYIRKYPDCIRKKGFAYVIGYLLSCISVFVAGIALLFVDAQIGKLGGYATNWYSYNSLPVLVGSICLFLAFLKMEIKKEWLCKCINVIAGATFGVYLIHEHRYLRYAWQQWLGVEQYADGPWMILHLLVSVILVFAVCVCVELVRKTIFTWLMGRKWVNQIFGRFAGTENKINGDS